MIRWFVAQSVTVKVMLIVCALLVLGIALRWEYVSREAAEAFRTRFRTEEPADTIRL